MKILLITFFCCALGSAISAQSFRDAQKKYARVKEAYKEKEKGIKENLASKKINISELELLIRYYKEEKELQLWGKNAYDKQFTLIKTYTACSSSGIIGPKRKQGDNQTPEGFYYIDRFNPASNFYLSLGINYPNKSDQILGAKNTLGGDIFIHGSCVTIGCIPITDNLIKELYVYCVESKNNGNKISVVIAPAKLTDQKFAQIKKNNTDKEIVNLWADLKAEYDYFEKENKVSQIVFLANGRHKVNGK